MQTQAQNKIIRRSSDRGHADHGWLKSQHTFSFADYYDPEFMGFSALRVINEDHIDGGMGFGMHPHRDMEIITYVISGSLRHQDSMGNSTVILPGEVQTMSAGTGVRHSEFNESKTQNCHLMQIWILPDEQNLKPNYGQKSFDQDLAKKDLVMVVSKDGRDGSIQIHQDASIYVSRMQKNKNIHFETKENRRLWIQVIKGQVNINDDQLQAGDAIAMIQTSKLDIKALQNSEILIFDLP